MTALAKVPITYEPTIRNGVYVDSLTKYKWTEFEEFGVKCPCTKSRTIHRNKNSFKYQHCKTKKHKEYLEKQLSKENQLFWDGHDWNRISKKSKNDPSNTFRIKTAYLHGALDGRLNSYFKVWVKDQYLADDVFGETVDYLSNRELIKNIDFFYQDRLNLYIPVPSAIIIANMYAERVPIKIIDEYNLMVLEHI